MSSKGMSRRDFVKRAAATAGGLGAASLFTASPGSAEATSGDKKKKVPPSDKIVVGVIGCGGMG
ncbi:MAG: twin-arginine translocation signal domain-containing protein, partial [Calditrichaeota bacterium]|nr:twin-arginine translocation signal domain-containing protein [Calditrichota bacterium]